MTLDNFKTVASQLLTEAQRIEDAKRAGYTVGSDDVLANFKRGAERTGLTAGQVLAVHLLKHVDAITSILCKPDLPMAEAPLGRFADLVNYCKLGWALVEERAGGGEVQLTLPLFYSSVTPTRLTQHEVNWTQWLNSTDWSRWEDGLPASVAGPIEQG